MAVYLAPGWEVELGYSKDWLFVTLIGPEGPAADATGITESLELLMEQDLISQMTIDLSCVDDLPPDLLDEFICLHQATLSGRETVRLFGLSDELAESLYAHPEARHIPIYQNRDAAVEGLYRPRKPR